MKRRQSGCPAGDSRRVITGGRIAPRDTPLRQRAANEGNKMLTEGNAAIDAEPLSLEQFEGWARYTCIGLHFEGLGAREGPLR